MLPTREAESPNRLRRSQIHMNFDPAELNRQSFRGRRRRSEEDGESVVSSRSCEYCLEFARARCWLSALHFPDSRRRVVRSGFLCEVVGLFRAPGRGRQFAPPVACSGRTSGRLVLAVVMARANVARLVPPTPDRSAGG
jgi:hypothetical protein